MNLWEREWTINAGPEDGFLRSGSPTLVLQKNGVNGGSSFDVHFEGNQMPAEWNDCSLVPRGTEPFRFEGDPLPKFDESQTTKVKYNDAIRNALARTTTSTRRLEGELDDGLGRRAVFLFLARNAVAFKDDEGNTILQDLLVLKRSRHFWWSSPPGTDPGTPTGIPIDDGTVHGNPK